MSAPSTLIATTIARAVASARSGLAGSRRRIAELIVAAWELLGSGQARNLLLVIVALLGMHLASRVERGEAELARIAEAQGVMGYATMRQLEALGLAPHPGAGASAAGGASHPAPLVAPRRAIDPNALVPAPSSASEGLEPLAGSSRSMPGAPAPRSGADLGDDGRAVAADPAQPSATATDRVAIPARPATTGAP